LNRLNRKTAQPSPGKIDEPWPLFGNPHRLHRYGYRFDPQSG
jgi:hypothetical protein